MKRYLAALLLVLLASPVLGQSVEGSEINELPAVTTPADTDMLPTDQVGAVETRKITRAQIVAGVLALLQAHEAATGVHGITAFAETLLDDTTAAEARTTLGLGTAATSNTGDFEAAGAVATHEADTTSVHGIADTSALLDSGDIGSTVQAQDAELAALAGLTSAAGKGIEFTGPGTAATFDLTTAGKALLDDASATAQLTTLGLAPQGSGNGLDADTVDGSHASEFAASSHAHAASDVTSGTLAHERGGLESDISAADGIPHITGGATSIIAPGTSAQVLTSNGAGVAPTFQDAAGGGIGGALGATDNAIVRTDGTGGATVQNASGVTVSDANAMSLRDTSTFVGGKVTVDNSFSTLYMAAGLSGNAYRQEIRATYDLEINAGSAGSGGGVAGGGGGTVSISGGQDGLYDNPNGMNLVRNGLGFGRHSGNRGGWFISFETNTTDNVPTDAVGDFSMQAQSALSSATNNISGGDLSFAGGNGASASSGTANGGNVNLDGGQGFGTGAHGNVVVGGTRGGLVVGTGGLRILGYTTTSADPTTTEYPNSKDAGIHKNSSSGDVFLVFNDGGSIKKVLLN